MHPASASLFCLRWSEEAWNGSAMICLPHSSPHDGILGQMTHCGASAIAARCISHRSAVRRASQCTAFSTCPFCPASGFRFPQEYQPHRLGREAFSSLPRNQPREAKRAFCPLPRNLQRKSEEQPHSPYRISQNSIFSSLGPWMKKYFAPLSQKSIWLTLSLSIV